MLGKEEQRDAWKSIRGKGGGLGHQDLGLPGQPRHWSSPWGRACVSVLEDRLGEAGALRAGPDVPLHSVIGASHGFEVDSDLVWHAFEEFLSSRAYRRVRGSGSPLTPNPRPGWWSGYAGSSTGGPHLVSGEGRGGLGGGSGSIVPMVIGYGQEGRGQGPQRDRVAPDVVGLTQGAGLRGLPPGPGVPLAFRPPHPSRTACPAPAPAAPLSHAAAGRSLCASQVLLQGCG